MLARFFIFFYVLLLPYLLSKTFSFLFFWFFLWGEGWCGVLSVYVFCFCWFGIMFHVRHFLMLCNTAWVHVVVFISACIWLTGGSDIVCVYFLVVPIIDQLWVFWTSQFLHHVFEYVNFWNIIIWTSFLFLHFCRLEFMFDASTVCSTYDD